MNQSSLLEILGIFIAFSSIMLVLSLLVTALTQAIVHFLSIRANNLKAGLAELLASAQQQTLSSEFVRAKKELNAKREIKDLFLANLNKLKMDGEDSKKIDASEKSYKKKLAEYEKAAEVVKNLEESVAQEDVETKNESEITKSAARIAEDVLESNSLIRPGKISWIPKSMAPKTTWLLSEELEILLFEQLKRHKELSAGVIEKAMGWFSRMERGLSQRFNIIVRCITLVCALFVAFLFQVSAPDVLRRLSTDPQYRAKVEMQATNLLGKLETDYAELVRYEDVSDEALQQLQNKHTDLQKTLEEVSGIGNTKQDIIHELSIVLDDHPEKKELVREYESILEQLHRKGYEKAGEMVEESVSMLALFDIAPWSKGWMYYRSFTNLLGVLMTAVFISLGAPFWFNSLRQLVNLRDALQPDRNKKKSD